MRTHALALVREELNSTHWQAGRHPRVRSRSRRMQELVGDGGDLWIVLSRRGAGGRRRYSLSHRFVGCRAVTLPDDGPSGFGRHAVRGDPARSRFFARNDAKLLLMSLRFDPWSPLRSWPPGQALRTPRTLADGDVALLADHAELSARHAVFMSYSRRDVLRAREIAGCLDRDGVGVFRDEDALQVGRDWRQGLDEAIRVAKHFVLLMSPDSARSTWVRKELALAEESGSHVVPVALRPGARRDFRGLSGLEVLEWGVPSPAESLGRLLRTLGAARVRSRA